MQNRSALIIGASLVAIGLIFLVGNIFGFNPWVIVWPAILIGLGGWLLLRPRMVTPGTAVDFRFLGEIKRRGAWVVAPEDLTAFIGDIDLDFSQAVVPIGQTRIHISGFVGDVDVVIPAGLGIRVLSSAFVTDIKFMGQKHEGFLSPVEFSNPEYATAERKILLETAWFVGDIKINSFSPPIRN